MLVVVMYDDGSDIHGGLIIAFVLFFFFFIRLSLFVNYAIKRSKWAHSISPCSRPGLRLIVFFGFRGRIPLADRHCLHKEIHD